MRTPHHPFLGRWPVLAGAIASCLSLSGCKDEHAPAHRASGDRASGDRASADRASANDAPEGPPRSDMTGSSENGARGAGNETLSLDSALDNDIDSDID